MIHHGCGTSDEASMRMNERKRGHKRVGADMLERNGDGHADADGTFNHIEGTAPHQRRQFGNDLAAVRLREMLHETIKATARIAHLAHAASSEGVGAGFNGKTGLKEKKL
ncbi:hypothetical protein V5F32_00925 [Xanthobacter oligotrophicus]|uniref:Uncharacterized protein n=1 Tax=Xanthobacter oligotrophicus TaxID=2607286 RepID=A0ABW6ZPS0_9HYPH